MVMAILEMRVRLRTFYQKFRFIINPIVKFVIAFIVFSQINDAIGYDARFAKTTIILLLSAVCAVTPGAVMVFFAMALSLVHIFCISKFLALFVLLAFLILYGMLLRFTPKLSIVALLIPILAKYNLHFAVPMVLGSTSNPLSILPAVCGVFIYYLIAIIRAAAQRQVSLSLDDILQLYTDIADAIIENKQMFIMMVVFSLVIISIYVVRKISFEYSFEISLGVGVTVNILGFLIADLKYNVTVNVLVLILMSLICGGLALITQFFRRVLDYTAIERVQFEDDDYFYYVKAVPKVRVSIPKLDVKHINRKVEDEQEVNDYEEDVHDTGRVREPVNQSRVLTRDEEYRSSLRDRFQDDSGREMLKYGFERSDMNVIPVNKGNDENEYEIEMTLGDETGTLNSLPDEYEVNMTLEDDDV